jgi:hypothetical protein
MLGHLPRKFIIGASVLDDPIPDGTLVEAKEMLANQYSLLRHTEIYESDANVSNCGAYLEYKVILPPVKTNG